MEPPKIEYRNVVAIDLPAGEAFHAPVADLPLIEADVVGYVAKKKGIPPWQIEAWLLHMNLHGQCSGFTKTGERCRNNALKQYPSLKTMRDGEDDRCRHHQIRMEGKQ